MVQTGSHAGVIQARDTIRVAVDSGHLLLKARYSRRFGGMGMWFRLGVTKAGAHVYYGLGERVRRLAGAGLHSFYSTMAAAVVWRVDVAAVSYRAAPVGHGAPIPRPLPHNGHFDPHSMRAGFAFSLLSSMRCEQELSTQRCIAHKVMFVTTTSYHMRLDAYSHVCEYITDQPFLNAPSETDETARTQQRPRRGRSRERPAPTWQCACGAETSTSGGGDEKSQTCMACSMEILD